MPFLDKIVKSLNDNWLNSSLKFIPKEKIKCYGIAETILQPLAEDEDVVKTQKFPALIDDNGEAYAVEVDDKYHLIIYHRIESISNVNVSKQAFGDSPGDMQETANMSLLVIGFRDKIRKTSHWLEAAVKDNILMNIVLKDSTQKHLQSTIFFIGNSSFDKLSLLQREFSEVELNYPNLIVFETKYKIQSTYKQGCFINNCGC